MVIPLSISQVSFRVAALLTPFRMSKTFEFSHGTIFDAQDYLIRNDLGLRYIFDENGEEKNYISPNCFLTELYDKNYGTTKAEKIDFSLYACHSQEDIPTSSNEVYSIRSLRCNVPGCTKAFSSTQGLKYHKQHCHTVHRTFAKKPFVCHVSGCTKSYKSNNGLKYHMQHAHAGIDQESSG
ncbi:Z394 [Enterospora canceri]|uniref:Z394 n=1 Tax=Enterospora canceri TaxID=1081671 RepID=A0A1Y1S5A1_9MICR|nr:Z394 [Enterospora canceri]